MQALAVVSLLVAGAAHALQSNVSPTNYALLNGFFIADSSAARTSLSSVMYSPLGACVPTAQYPAVGTAPAVGGIVYSADSNNNLYASYFPTAMCGTQAAQITAAQLVTLGVITSTAQANAANDVQLNVAPFTNLVVSSSTTLSGTVYEPQLVGQVNGAFWAGGNGLLKPPCLTLHRPSLCSITKPSSASQRPSPRLSARASLSRKADVDASAIHVVCSSHSTHVPS